MSLDDLAGHPSLSVVVPLFNEEENLCLLVEAIFQVLSTDRDFLELILVDDGSQDRTVALARELAGREPRLRLIRHDHNRGLGAAIRTGMAAARGELILYTDADLPFDFKLIPQLLAKATASSVVVGYRANRGDGRRRWLLSKAYNLLCRYAFRLQVRDVNFACKLIPQRALSRMKLDSEGSFIDAELLLECRRQGLAITEFELTYLPRTRGLSTLSRPKVIVGILKEMTRYALRSCYRSSVSASKRLILNADDYGICPEVNAAVERLATTGLLGGVSVLANGKLWAQAVSFLRAHPKLSVGVHLNVVEGRPVSDSPAVRLLTGEDGSFVGMRALLKRWPLRPMAVSRAVEIEWRAQIERLLRAGVRLTHADSHQHLHAFPPAYRCAVRLCQEYGIPALRKPLENGAKMARWASSLALRLSLAVSRAIAPRTALRHNDHFLGFKRVGAYGITELIGDLQWMPEGLTEVALHPSSTDGIPYHNLHGNLEYQALLHESLLDQIRRLEIELTTWGMVTQ